MTAATFPLDAGTRQTSVMVGDGTTKTYGPFGFKIFDIDDVEVLRKDAGDDRFNVVDGPTIAKISDADWELFNVTFPFNVPDGTKFYVRGKRLQSRSLAVRKANQVDTDAIDKQLTQIGVVQLENTRAIAQAMTAERGIGGPPTFVEVPGEGNLLVFGDEGAIKNGPPFSDLEDMKADALTYRNQARDARDTAQAAAATAAADAVADASAVLDGYTASALASKTAAAASASNASASANSSASSATGSAISAATAGTARDAALSAAAAATAAAAVSGSVSFFDTYSAANAAVSGLPANQIVEINADETRRGVRTRYRKESGVLVFKIELFDNLRFLTPDMYGAKGDGTTDDTAALNLWLTAIGGGTGWILGGTYITTGAHTIASDTKIYAVGGATIKLKDNTASLPGSIIASAGTSGAHSKNISISGLTVDGNRANNINHGTPDGNGNQTPGWSGKPLSLVSMQFSDDPIVEDCVIKNGWSSGLWFVDCVRALAQRNKVIDCRKSGISARRIVPLNSVPFQDYRFIGNHVEGCTVGIHSIFGNKGGLIVGNTLRNNMDANGYPAFAWSGTYPNVWPSTGGFVNSSNPSYVSPVFQGDGAAVELTGYWTVAGAEHERDITISGNVCSGNMQGVRAEQEAIGVVVSGNVCTENVQNGIFIFSAQVITVTGNLCQRNSQNGIHIQKQSGQARPAEIIIADNITRENDGFGIVLSGLVGGRVSGNISAENNQDGALTGGFLGLFKSAGQACDTIDIVQNRVTEGGDYWIYGDGNVHSAIRVHKNNFAGTPSFKVNTSYAIFFDNVGYLTSGAGSSTVGQNATVGVLHGLDITPDFSRIRVTPGGDLQTDGRMYVDPSTINSTKFDVIRNGGAAGSLAFAWEVTD